MWNIVLPLMMLLSADAPGGIDAIVTTANGEKLPRPGSKAIYQQSVGGMSYDVPLGMVYVPAGEFTFGSSKKVNLEAFCIGKYHVTNAEYQVFLEATSSRQVPRYWTNGKYPDGKGNHPVAHISLAQAKAYCEWLSKETGRKYAIPTSEQWEKAARGPKGTLYPWGNEPGTKYEGGTLTTRYNYNAVIAAKYLKDEPKKEVVYDHAKSKHLGRRTTVDGIMAYDESGRGVPLNISGSGSVRGWVSHNTYTGFIYTDLFTKLNRDGGHTTPVGAYEDGKSGYGAYDMAGNLWTWCDTVIEATNGAEKGKKVNEIRGGSWYANGSSCKSVSIGEGRAASGAYNTVGFRIVMYPGSK